MPVNQTSKRQKGGRFPVPIMIPPFVSAPTVERVSPPVASPVFLGPMTQTPLLRSAWDSNPIPMVRSHFMGPRFIGPPRIHRPTWPVPAPFHYHLVMNLRKGSKFNPYFVLVVRYVPTSGGKKYVIFKLSKDSPIFNVFLCETNKGYCTLQSKTSAMIDMDDEEMRKKKAVDVKEFFNASMGSKITLTAPPTCIGRLNNTYIDVFVADITGDAPSTLPSDEIKALSKEEVEKGSSYISSLSQGIIDAVSKNTP